MLRPLDAQRMAHILWIFKYWPAISSEANSRHSAQDYKWHWPWFWKSVAKGLVWTPLDSYSNCFMMSNRYCSFCVIHSAITKELNLYLGKNSTLTHLNCICFPFCKRSRYWVYFPYPISFPTLIKNSTQNVMTIMQRAMEGMKCVIFSDRLPCINNLDFEILENISSVLWHVTTISDFT